MLSFHYKLKPLAFEKFCRYYCFRYEKNAFHSAGA